VGLRPLPCQPFGSGNRCIQVSREEDVLPLRRSMSCKHGLLIPSQGVGGQALQQDVVGKIDVVLVGDDFLSGLDRQMDELASNGVCAQGATFYRGRDGRKHTCN
jgi:hypothetical protein